MNNGNYSYATRLRNAQDLYAAIKEMVDYNPSRTQESIVGFSAHLDLIIASNASEVNLLQEYSFAVDERQKVFFQNPDSLEKKFLALKNAVISQYGKKSMEIKILKRIHYRMYPNRGTNSTAIVPSENENSEASVNMEQTKSVDHSEKTYGSMAKNLSDFVTMISGFNDYQPGIEEFKLENLTTYLAFINSLNNNVIEKKIKLSIIKNSRKGQYDELKDRGDRIKSYIKSKYGANSHEYKLVRSINI